jgi:hypothetical protein
MTNEENKENVSIIPSKSRKTHLKKIYGQINSHKIETYFTFREIIQNDFLFILTNHTIRNINLLFNYSSYFFIDGQLSRFPYFPQNVPFITYKVTLSHSK